MWFGLADWKGAEKAGDAAYLLHIPPSEKLSQLPASVREYLQEGERLGVHLAYKCRVRTPWHSVPHVYKPDAFLTYMSGRYPALVINGGDFVAPNNLHTIRLLHDSTVSPHALALGWRSSLTRLSVELQGHSMGGGMLKLEPREASRVAVPVTRSLVDADFFGLDARAKTQSHRELTEVIDSMLLAELGLTRKDCLLLREAAEELMQRRYAGGRR